MTQGHEPTGIATQDEVIQSLIKDHVATVVPRLERLWMYYRNPATHGVSAAGAWDSSSWIDGSGCGSGGGGRVRLGQEMGLPLRLRPDRRDPRLDDRVMSPEVVIENDIAWRLHIMVEFLFGQPIKIRSLATNAGKAREIEGALEQVWEASGGVALLQDAALLGHVYGHVDLLVRQEEGETVRVEVIDPTRGVPALDPADYRRLEAYAIHVVRGSGQDRKTVKASWWRRVRDGATASRHRTSESTEIFTRDAIRLVENGELVRETLRDGHEPLPIAHIQNQSQPFVYGGLSEVEPLIPMQDELNTRLSDRASRVTLQCFKMYLAKGIDHFTQTPVGPGQVWQTDNLGASIQAFGGDAETPGEDAHIREVREALDKASAVPPVATGVVQAKVGNLSSANALRLTLVGLLSRTARKRVTYGDGIKRACGFILAALDARGELKTDPSERRVEIEWPDPLPRDAQDQVALAKAKVELGAGASTGLAELGDARADAGLD